MTNMYKIYNVKDNIIEIFNTSDFDIEHILQCGQIFTYAKQDDKYIVFSKNEIAIVSKMNDRYYIKSSNVDYFVNFFDLDTDYQTIKKNIDEVIKINKFNIDTKSMYNFCGGIRILKQSFIETVIGFIISANNNIARIKKSMEYIRGIGERKNFDGIDYFEFPTLEKLLQQNELFFEKAGCGYRKGSICKTLQKLKLIDEKKLYLMPTEDLRTFLLTLDGVGPKVADCILLFCFSKMDVFPVDTWVKKIYKDLFGDCTNEKFMRKNLIDKFLQLSGYAQQYLFYYKRNFDTKIDSLVWNKIKKIKITSIQIKKCMLQ